MKMAPNSGRTMFFAGSDIVKSFSTFLAHSRHDYRLNNRSEFSRLLSGGMQPEHYSILEYEEKFLNNIPSELNASYAEMSKAMKLLILCGTLATIALRYGLSMGTIGQKITQKKTFQTILSSIFGVFILTAAIQDLCFGPSRVSIPYLLEKGWLPSPLSKIQTLTPQISTSSRDETGGDSEQRVRNSNLSSLAVHYLQYMCPDSFSERSNMQQMDILYFNHGFGASSLSWLPSIPILVERLNSKIGICHDAPGFGFTERPKSPLFSSKKETSDAQINDINPYSFSASAGIGNALLNKAAHEIDGNTIDLENNPIMKQSVQPLSNKNVGLLGHSMGSITTLKMALQMPLSTKKTIVLVSPAILFSKSNVSKNKSNSVSLFRKRILSPMITSRIYQTLVKFIFHSIIKPLQIVWSVMIRVLFDIPIQYLLRRLASNEPFWKNSLSSAWGHKNLLSNNILTKYRWPSVLKGWERGILLFSKAQTQLLKRPRRNSISNENNIHDKSPMELLRLVLKLPNTKVVIMHGTKDFIVPLKNSQKLANEFHNLQVVELEGQGHDPFEEKVDEFVVAVENFFSEDSMHE